jgi:hypothetical protein
MIGIQTHNVIFQKYCLLVFSQISEILDNPFV